MPNLKTFDQADSDFPSKWKRLGVLIVDFFVGLIFAFLFFGAIGYPTYINLPSANENKANYAENGKKLIQIADESKLQKSKDDEYTSLLSMEETGKLYLINLLKTSCYYNNIPYQVLENNQKVEIQVKLEDTFANLDNDFLSYYFLEYKALNNIGTYPTDVSYKYYVNSTILKLDSMNKDLVKEDFDCDSDTFYLNSESTTKLMNYLSFGDTNEPYTFYKRLQSLYQQAASIGIKDIEENYRVYKVAYQKFVESYNSYAKGFIYTVIICYIPGALITFLVFPLCFKKGRTVGYRFFGMKSVNKIWDPISWPMLLIRALVQTIIEFGMTFFIPLFMGQMEFMSVALFGNVTMFMLCMFSLLLSLLSLIFFAINKNDQTISDLASLSYVVSISSDLDRNKEE